MAQRPLEKEGIYLDGGHCTTQLMRDSLGSLAGTRDNQVLIMASRGMRIHGWRAEQRVPIQFWPHDPNTFDPHRYVDSEWNPPERDQVVAYLDACYEAPFMSPYPVVWCPFGCEHPEPQGQVSLTDGTWWFMDILIHYLRAHAVKPPVEFLTHIQHLGYRVPVFSADQP